MRIKIKVFSPAKQSKIKKKSGNFYLVSLKSRSKASQELISLLANHFKVSPENIKVVSESNHNMKYVEIADGNVKLQPLISND